MASQAMLHEKPFAGINGSGKHCNWSMAIVADNDLDGANLLKPGKTPHQNIRFLVFLAAVLKGVHKHAGLLRAGIATSGNEHRLGANEAPPAIISVFMGQMLTRLIEDIAAGKEATKEPEQQLINLGVASCRRSRRTTPTATGRRRSRSPATSSSSAPSGRRSPSRSPSRCSTPRWRDAIDELTARDPRRAQEVRSRSTTRCSRSCGETFKETASVRFEGNNYSAAWVKEAAKRGLPNLRRTPEALAQLVDQVVAGKCSTSLGILTKEELESRYHVRLERYIKDMLIEMHTMLEMVDTMILPAAYSYFGSLATNAADARTAGIKQPPQVERANEVGALARKLRTTRDALNKTIEKAEGMHEHVEKCAALLTAEGASRMADVRAVSDALELLVADELWPLPKYREMLFPV